MHKAMKIIGLITFFALVTILSIVYVREPIIFETYLIPSTMKEGWVTIELGNPKCPHLRHGRGWREVVIPESGYVCTSTPQHTKLFYDWYYLVDQNGKRTPLAYEQQIFKRNTIQLDALNPNCKVVADSFWYGRQDKIDNQEAVALQKRHPECSGTTFPLK
jgi:hypothetical protein